MRSAFALLFVVAACVPPTTVTVPPVSMCAAPSGAGTPHDGDTITTDTTWTAAGSPHVITYTPVVKAGATLTIEPCAVVQIAGGYGLDVEGTLTAVGDLNRHITITASDAANPWTDLHVVGGFADLEYVDVSNGGANASPMVDVWGKSTPTRTQNARLKHVTLKNSAQFGLGVERTGTLTDDSTDVTITGSKLQPMLANGSSVVGGLPDGVFTGNGVDEILVLANDSMLEDTTWHDRGIPYRVGDTNKNGGGLKVGDNIPGPLVTWTIDPGVTIRVTPAGSLSANHSTMGIMGSIVAQGTAAKPITFTAATEAQTPGSWRGLVFEAAPADTTALDHVVVKYAGGPSQADGFHCKPGSAGSYSSDEDAAIAFFGQPFADVLTNSTISDSAADGIDLAYDGDPVSLLGGNTFTNVARCKLTLPRDVNGGCPNPVPACP